jgi:hypothetical protein
MQANPNDIPVQKLSTTLEDATTKFMRPGSIAREILGDDFVDHFGGTREHEVGLWNAAVTNWEGEWNAARKTIDLMILDKSRDILNWHNSLISYYSLQSHIYLIFCAFFI